MTENLERWLAGPVESVPALLQPVAHALIQANKEIRIMLVDFPREKLWDRTSGMASVGFHLQHIKGVLDRLFTYARGESLTDAQLEYLRNEGTSSGEDVLAGMSAQVEASVAALADFDPEKLTEFRGVGRKQLPSTVIGLLVHAAEHTMRHTGQLLVTVSVIRHNGSGI